LLMSLFHLMHECVHDTVFVQRMPNRLLAHVCGGLLILPAIWFRYFHHAHHRYTQQVGKDPELLSEKPSSLWQWGWHISGIPIWYASFKLLVQAIQKPVRESYLPVRYERSARLEMLLLLSIYLLVLIVSVVTGNSAVLYLWVFPLLIGQPFLRLYLLAEHTDCDTGTNMLRNTRTVLTNRVVRWFTWNMPYHTEHHVYPTVPFHQLPRLHKLMSASLVEVDESYMHFNARYMMQVANQKK